MTITLDPPTECEAELQAAARLQGKEIAAFVTDAVKSQLRRDVLPQSETQLLEIMNTPLAPEARKECDALIARQAGRELTSAKRILLAERINAVEIANAKRWQAIADLVVHRGHFPVEMARELEIPFL